MGKRDELIARLEAATEGSRELDLALFRELGAPLPDSFGPLKLDLTWQADGTATMPVGDMQVRYTPPAYTTSLDAIVALIERKLPAAEGWAWGAGDNPMIVERFNAEAWVRNYNALRDNTRWEARSSTAPLALCIALLYALSREDALAQGGRGDG